MKLVARFCFALILSASTLASTQGVADDAVISAWEFDDVSDTRLNETIDEQGKSGRWSDAFEGSGTTGDGAYRLSRGTGGTANVYASLDQDSEGKIAVTYVLRGWTFTGKTASETLRLGLVDKTHNARPHVLCQFKVERTSADEVTVGVEAFGDGSDNVAETITVGAESDESLTLRIVYDPNAHRYEGHYAVGDRELIRLGGSKTSPDRQANYLRIGATGTLDSTRAERVDFDRVAVQVVKSEPE